MFEIDLDMICFLFNTMRCYHKIPCIWSKYEMLRVHRVGDGVGNVAKVEAMRNRAGQDDT